MSDLKTQCQVYWQRIKSIVSEIEAQKNTSAIGTAAANPTNADVSQLFREYEKRLKAELEVLKATELRSLPGEENVLKLVLKQGALKSIEELNEAVVLLRAKRSEAAEELKQEEETHSQLQTLNETLKQKLSSFPAGESQESPTLETVLQNESEELRKVTARHKYFRSKLKQLLIKHFPTPSQGEATLNESRELDGSNMMSLSALVGRLVEQSLNCPAHPYLDIDQTVWPSHLEILLRCQIAVRHPEDSRKIRLSPFHL